MNPTKADKLTTISLSIFRLNGQLIEWGNHFCQPHGLTSARWQVLGAIALAPQPPSIPQIAMTIGVTRQGVLKQVNLLMDEGLIQPLSNPAHKRSPLYELTKAGHATFSVLDDRWNKHVEKIATQFTAGDLDAALRVISMLTQLYDNEPTT